MTAYIGYTGFQLYQESVSISGLNERHPSQASTQYNSNDALYLSLAGSLGLFAQVTAAVKCTHIYVSMFTAVPLLRPAATNLSTVFNEQILAVRCAGNGLKFAVGLTGTGATPYRLNVATNTNSTLNTIIWTDAGATGDVLGGQIYVNTLQQQFTIVTDTVSTGVRTVTVVPLPSRAVTTGDTITATTIGVGQTGVQFNATAPPQAVSNTVAGKTGGNINIEDIVLGPTLPTPGGAFISSGNANPYAVVSFPVVP